MESKLEKCKNDKCQRHLPLDGGKCVCEVISSIEKVPWMPEGLKCRKCPFYSEGERRYPEGWADSWCEQTCSKDHYTKLFSDNYEDFLFIQWYASTCKDCTGQVEYGKDSMCCRLVFE